MTVSPYTRGSSPHDCCKPTQKVDHGSCSQFLDHTDFCGLQSIVECAESDKAILAEFVLPVAAVCTFVARCDASHIALCLLKKPTFKRQSISLEIRTARFIIIVVRRCSVWPLMDFQRRYAISAWWHTLRYIRDECTHDQLAHLTGGRAQLISYMKANAPKSVATSSASMNNCVLFIVFCAGRMMLFGQRLSPSGARLICASYLCFLAVPFVFFKGRL